VAPHLQNLEQQNRALQQRLAKEARHRLDAQVERAAPNYREIDRDPRWHRWLLGIDAHTGQIRQRILDNAIASGSAARVAAFFNVFQGENAATGQAGTSQAPRRGRSVAAGKPVYTRPQIASLYQAHQKGAYVGREAEWNRLERDIIAAGREGRVLNPDFVTK
jgi:hypothetical protein